MTKVLLFLAPGFEEIEALTVVDILRRGSITVDMAATVDGLIEGRNQIKVLADMSIDDVKADDYEMVVLPGGLDGTNHLKKDPRVRQIIEAIYARGKFTAAICAAPTVLSAIGLLDGKKATSYPAMAKELSMTRYSEDRVVIDGNIITSRSAGTAMEFSLTLLELLAGQETMTKVKDSVLA